MNEINHLGCRGGDPEDKDEGKHQEAIHINRESIHTNCRCRFRIVHKKQADRDSKKNTHRKGLVSVFVLLQLSRGFWVNFPQVFDQLP